MGWNGGKQGGQMRTRTKDEKGHYERWPEVRVHPDLDTLARAYLSDPSCEFESMSDMIRGSVVECINRKPISNPGTKSLRTIFKMIDAENRASTMRREFKRRIEETAREAYELVGDGKTGEAAQHVHKVLMFVRDIDEQDPWREEYERVIKQKFGYLLRMTQGASLVPSEGISLDLDKFEVQ